MNVQREVLYHMTMVEEEIDILLQALEYFKNDTTVCPDLSKRQLAESIRNALILSEDR